MAFLDEEEGVRPPEATERPRRPENGRRRRRQQFLVRRLIGVGLGIGFLILVVLAFRGCLEARKDRGITNYVTDVGTIMTESQQRGEEFFDTLEQGSSSSVEFEKEIRLVRGTSATLLDRAENLDVPGQMSDANDALILSLTLRRDALEKIADNTGAATADAETAEAVATITNQMSALYSSDVLYGQLAVPEIERVLEEEEVSAPELPPGNFMPDPEPSSPQNIEWLDQTKVVEALALAGGGEEAESGTHGMGLVQVAIGDTALSPDSTNSVSSRDVAVDVQNQGTVEESGVTVIASIDGEQVGQGRIETIGPGETEQAKFQLDTTPEPGAEVTLEVLVEPVAGEAITDNNEASYTLVFG